ncbi:relaxase/mobilization nuclease domain-containing protein, partial [Microvirga mediterraneensis]
MLIKFFARGTGSGRGPVEYVTKGEGREAAPPTVLRGTPERTRELIDGIERQWRYTSGVISFAAEDAPSAADQRQVMHEFERTAFAGLEEDQYDILWVRHQHTEGSRVELHFVVPRVELSSGKALNIAPPGWQRLYDPLRDALNWEKGWARPDDPERAREAPPVRERPERLADREAITGYLSERIVAGDVQDRAGIVRALAEAGLEVTRQGRDYVSVKDRETAEKWRLKGAIYAEGWSRDPAGGSSALADAERAARDRERRARRAHQAREQLARRVRDRAAFHEKQFGGRGGGADHGSERRDAADRGQAEALASLDRLGVQRDRADGLALSLERDGLAQGRPGEPAGRDRARDSGAGAAEGEHTWAGPSEREGRHVPDPAGGLRGQGPDAV